MEGGGEAQKAIAGEATVFTGSAGIGGSTGQDPRLGSHPRRVFAKFQNLRSVFPQHADDPALNL